MNKEHTTWTRFSLPGFLKRTNAPGAKHCYDTPATQSASTTVPSKNVLVVDDDEIIRVTTGSKLQKAGYQVRTAGDCSEAIAAVGENRPDIILLDLNFPPDVGHGGMVAWDGFRLMHWLRGLQNTGDTEFIVISGSNSADCKRRAMATGAAAYFQKPLDHERLLQVMHRELERRAQGQQAQLNFEI